MSRRSWISIGLCLSLSLACSLPASLLPATSTPVIDMPITEVADPAVVVALTTGERAFAFELFQTLRSQEGNLIFSPYSVAGAFALAQAGARGETETEIAAVFHFPENAQLHPAFSAVNLDLNTPPITPGGTPEPDRAFQLQVANAAWGQAGHPFEQAYLDLLTRYHGSGLHEVDYQDPAAAAGEINRWVAEQTADRIVDLVPADQLSADTRLVLTNAIYFKGGWADEFVALPTPMAFTTGDGVVVDAPAIAQTNPFLYVAGEGYQALEIPYVGNRMGFVVVVPEAGRLNEIEAEVSQPWFDDVVARLQSTEVALTMPRLDYESRFELSTALEDLGLTTAFAPDAADFSGIDGTRELSIAAVIHQANITIDEHGTEAAAATALVMEAGAMPADEPLALALDRPFLYVIRDTQTGVILFIGRVLDPTR